MFQSLKLLSSDSTGRFSENKDNFVYFFRNTYMRRHCLSGYLPKQVEKICLQNNIELNSRDVKALGVGYSLTVLSVMASTGRLRPKGVLFSGVRYMKG